MKKHDYGQVVWWEDFEKARKRWSKKFFIVVCAFVFVLLILGNVIRDDNQKFMKIVEIERKVSKSEIRWKILSHIRGNVYSLNQGMEIVEMIITQSEQKGIPIPKIMGLANVESNFDPKAVSPKSKALGLFQIHPVTWVEYTKKLGLNVSLAAAFDPVLNAFVAIHILKDLYDNYKLKTSVEKEIWRLTFAAYRDGKTGLQKTGINKTHTSYFEKIAEFEENF